MRITSSRAGLALSLAAAATFILSAAGGAEPQRLAQARFDGWGYTVVADQAGGGATRASVEFDRGSVADLTRYAATNQVLARQLAAGGVNDLLVTVSFRRPLPLDEFQAWASTMPLRIDGYQIRVLANDGKRWTLGAAPSAGAVVSKADLQRSLDRLAAKGATDVRGVVAVEGRMAAGRYDAVANSVPVFLVDVSRSAVVYHLAMAQPSIDVSRMTPLVAPAYAWMEDFGLDNFQ